MPRPTRFWKLSGAGNDFVLVEGPLKGAAALAPKLCRRREGIGADGLLVARGRTVDYYNADGSRAFCGNGARCAAWWLAKGESRVRFTLSGIKAEAEVFTDRARLKMPDADAPKELMVDGLSVEFLDTGVPHAVLYVRGLGAYPVVERGRDLRHHRAFGKAGTNVDFITVTKDSVAIRTYERGVEDETLACGTGAVAAALVSGLPSPVEVHALGGILKVSFAYRKGGGFSDVWLEGPVRLVYTGEVAL